MQLQPQATTLKFNARFPDGADYVIVPVAVERDGPVLLGWVFQRQLGVSPTQYRQRFSAHADTAA